MSKKRDFSTIGKNILTQSESGKPTSLSDLMSIDTNKECNGDIDSIKEVFHEPLIQKSTDSTVIRECISISKADSDMVNELSIKCAAEGQKTTKADVYRASIRHFSKLSPSVMASKIREVRKDKKTHN